MDPNPVKFAVVREDPLIEDALVRRVRARRVLLIASGGCTALTLRALHPELEITLLDPNPAQLERVERKAKALRESNGAERRARFGIGSEDPRGLNADGAFESLFRSFRRFLEEFVTPRETWLEPSPDRLAQVFAHPYWPVAFELFFSDALLNTMFTPAATQHAPKGSYPAYFRRVLERALLAPGARDNYFLHHVFLGHYLDRPEALPLYLREAAPEAGFDFVLGSFDRIADLGEFDLIHLSNIFDWMDRAAVARLAERLAREIKPGSVLVYRQLNNENDLRPLFGPAVHFDAVLGAELLARERAAFYMNVAVGIKQGKIPGEIS